MPRLQAFLESIGQAFCEKGRKALLGQWAFGEAMHEIAKTAFDHAHRKLPGPDFRLAIAECAAVESREYERRLGELIVELSTTHSVLKTELPDYLRALPATIRQMLRRPSDPTGQTVPEKLTLYKPEEFAILLPPRMPRFRPGDKPAGLDGWTLTEFRGFGQCSETWRAEDPEQGEASPAALRFVTEAETSSRVKSNTSLFTQTFSLNSLSGILPLRSVYLETDPPCLESPFVYGYDLTGLLFDWKWRYDSPKPEAALKLIRRLATIVGEAHLKGKIHRDLKPSNILLRPGEDKKFTLWIAGFGWGQIQGMRSLELEKGTPRSELQRLVARGEATTLYASPQQAKQNPPSTTDDVHALGVIWYQLLKRDVTAPPPVGNDWIAELRPAGFTDSQARLLQACLSTRTDKRPKNAAALAEQLASVTVAPPEVGGSSKGSKLIALQSGSSGHIPHAPAPTTSRGKSFDAEAAAASAAALLSAAGGAPPGGGPGGAEKGGLKVVKNSIGMTFVRIAPGSFRMGAPEDEVGRYEHEGPPHDVKISKAFYMSIVPITQVQYEGVTHRNPSKFNRSNGGGPDHPVESVSWEQAVKFCERLSRLPDEEVHRRTYRLPTEAEWEYACRAGTTTAYHFGDKITGREVIFGGGEGRYNSKSTGPVSQALANAWGLHDMHGNVQEWVQDWFEEYYYLDSPPADPHGPKHGTLRTVRGGCWSLPAIDCRSAARRGYGPDIASDTIGFRVVLVMG